MVVGNVPEAVDFIVAGAGPGGYVAALRAAQAGRRVLLIEGAGRDGIGGVCLRTGCIPSKTLIEVAALNHRLQTPVMGLSVGASRFDALRFQTEKNHIIDRLTRGVEGSLNKAGVELAAGTLSLTDADTAVINMADGGVRFLTFKSLVLATGSSPMSLEALPFDGDTVLNSTDVLALESVPESMAVIGAGYIGLELGMALAKLGARVTVIDVEERVLPRMDPLITKSVQARMQTLGVTFCLATKATGFDSGVLSLETAAGDIDRVSADKVLVAVGRRPNSDGLGLRGLGIGIDKSGLVEVSENRKLSPRIAAIGDITPGPALAHKAMAEAAIAVAALCGKSAAFDAVVPEIVFCDPEVASAGLTVSEANALDIDASSARFPLSASGRAATIASHDGFTQVVFDARDGTLLGVQMVGPHASERIAEAVLAIELGAAVEDLALIIHPHPTLSESLNEAAQAALGKSLH